MLEKRKKLTVIDYGMGNLFNVIRAFESIDCDVKITKDKNTIINSDRLLLPGVGAFEDGIKDLKSNNLDDVIKEFSETGRPLLGICLGMHLLMTCSEENGLHHGLDIIKGKVVRFKDPIKKTENYKIPQIGWNELIPANNPTKTMNSPWSDTILKGFDDKIYMYFLHSYFVVPEKKEICIAQTLYGRDLFCSVYKQDQIYGCQYHPERSGEQGLTILKNFINL